MVALLLSALIQLAPNAIGMEAHAQMADLPHWCKHGDCSAYFAAKHDRESWAGTTAEVVETLKDQPEVLSLLIWGGIVAFCVLQLKQLALMMSKDFKEFKIAQLSHLKGD